MGDVTRLFIPDEKPSKLNGFFIAIVGLILFCAIVQKAYLIGRTEAFIESNQRIHIKGE